MQNTTYRVERSADGLYVGCYYGQEGVEVYSHPLRRVAWWELLPWQECPPFETRNNGLGCFVLACSILAHHFGEEPADIAAGQSGKKCEACLGNGATHSVLTGILVPCPLCKGNGFVGTKTYGRFFGFAVEVIRTQQLKPGEFYTIDTEVINEWLAMKPAATPAEAEPETLRQ